MQIKVGDEVVVLENNLKAAEFNGRIGVVERIDENYVDKCPYRVLGVLDRGIGLWCDVRLATKLDKLLAGIE